VLPGDHHGLAGAVLEMVATKIEPYDPCARRGGKDLADRQSQQQQELCYRMRLGRVRGMILRLVRRRVLAAAVGAAVVVPAAWIEFAARLDAWWLEALALIGGATGLALLWTALTGARPDWIDRERGRPRKEYSTTEDTEDTEEKSRR
jgi:hypothetical protein